MIDFIPNPNRTISTGTSAVRGALRNMLTQGSRISSIIRLVPIRMPNGIPIRIAIATPDENA